MPRKPPKVLQAFYGAGNPARVDAGLDATERPQSVLTPREIVLELARTAGTLILDPCTIPSNPLGAPVFCCGPGLPGGDGLALPWPVLSPGEGFTWVNYPFGDAEEWLGKCAREGALGCPIWAIGPLRTHRHGTVAALATADHCWSTWPVTFQNESGVPHSGGFAFPLFLAGWNVPVPDRVCPPSIVKGRELRSGRIRLEAL